MAMTKEQEQQASKERWEQRREREKQEYSPHMRRMLRELSTDNWRTTGVLASACRLHRAAAASVLGGLMARGKVERTVKDNLTVWRLVASA